MAWKLAGLPLDHEPACMGAQVAVADFPLFPLPRYPATLCRSIGFAERRNSATSLPATSPAENGPRYFPVILTVTSSNHGIQDLVEPAGTPVFFLAAFFGRGESPRK